MKKVFLGLLAFAFLLSVSASHVALAKAGMDKPAKPSLYKRLGGYDALAAVTDDLLGRLIKDKQLARFFPGLSTDSKKRLRQNFVDLMCSATGGPCVYIGRDMKTAHAGLGITEADWQAAVNDLTATLDHFKVPMAEKNEVLGIATSLKKDIVEKK